MLQSLWIIFLTQHFSGDNTSQTCVWSLQLHHNGSEGTALSLWQWEVRGKCLQTICRKEQSKHYILWRKCALPKQTSQEENSVHSTPTCHQKLLAWYCHHQSLAICALLCSGRSQSSSYRVITCMSTATIFVLSWVIMVMGSTLLYLVMRCFSALIYLSWTALLMMMLRNSCLVSM